MKLSLEDSRRLTGPNLFWDYPGAIIDVTISGVASSSVIKTWEIQVRSFLDALGWGSEKITSRQYKGGASLIITAPVDALYSATEVNEAAWLATLAQFGLGQSQNFSSTLNSLKTEIQQEQNPSLSVFLDAAHKHNKPALVDDDYVSIGYGRHSKVFDTKKIPEPTSINWNDIKAIPLGLITGTNGKSTSVRLASAIISAANKIAGITSTDYIRVGDEVLDTGDYSGPGGARALLRNTNVDIALLEVARGGLLRRGLAVNKADAALITNVAADHLGEYGINTVNELAEAKFIVHRALNSSSPLVLNADDINSVTQAKKVDQLIHWFSESEFNPIIQSQISKKATAAFIRDDMLILNQNGDETEIVDIKNVPITFNGAAKHNVQNCLGVSLLCTALGISPNYIKQGLLAFKGDYKDNPGRGNIIEKNGRKIIIDFAHNEHGLSAIAQTINSMPAKRRLVLICQAGDRSDYDIQAMVHASLLAKPDRVIVCELPDHLRGRSLGDVPQVMTNALISSGFPENEIIHASSVFEGSKKALAWAKPDDLLLLLALTDRDKVLEHINSIPLD